MILVMNYIKCTYLVSHVCLWSIVLILETNCIEGCIMTFTFSLWVFFIIMFIFKGYAHLRLFPYTALVLYDYLLTFNQEVEFFWNRKRPRSVPWYRLNFAMTIFFLSRYTPIVGSINIVVSTLISTSPDVCPRLVMNLSYQPFGLLIPAIEVHNV